LQLSNLISTIALTYTLLGISLGIGELSASKLDVNTINQTISKLTEQFSMAFMTSVIGLPLSAILRSIIVIFYEQSKKETNLTIQKLIK
jgi:ribose/xylose/arabinose/galactoside ABC-type transport system permease subunit